MRTSWRVLGAHIALLAFSSATPILVPVVPATSDIWNADASFIANSIADEEQANYPEWYTPTPQVNALSYAQLGVYSFSIEIEAEAARGLVLNGNPGLSTLSLSHSDMFATTVAPTSVAFEFESNYQSPADELIKFAARLSVAILISTSAFLLLLRIISTSKLRTTIIEYLGNVDAPTRSSGRSQSGPALKP